MKIKEGFAIVAMATIVTMTAYKLGRKDGVSACLKRIFEDNPELRELNFKFEDCSITMKK